MRLKNIPGAREHIAESQYVVENPELQKGIWREKFGNNHPLMIEVGTGKGRFIMDMAVLHPEINYVGIEKYSSVLLRGVQKLEEQQLSNVLFIRMDAEQILNVFAEDEVDRIYLNFSDPWPKDRHARRRLTSRQYLERYDRIMKLDGVVEFKTDNTDLFDFSLEEIEPAGWKLDSMTRDLHADPVMMQGNVMTEYEERFSSMGNHICKYIISRDAKKNGGMNNGKDNNGCKLS